MERIKIYHAPGPGYVELREITAAEECALAGARSSDAISLLDMLIKDTPDAVLKPGEACILTAADRDRLIAAIYCDLYGNHIFTSPKCTACGELFDFDFLVTDMMRSLEPPTPPSSPDLKPGLFQTDSGITFRLPTGRDECRIENTQSDDLRRVLLESCLSSHDLTPEVIDEIEAKMEEFAPTADFVSEETCPECGASQLLHFNLETYFLQTLRHERRGILRDIHKLALTYGWSLTEIQSLPRTQRQTLVQFAETEYAPSRRESLVK